MKIITNSSIETHEFAKNFASKINPGSVVGLIGTLGAGKTVFVQGLAEGIGIGPDTYVTSPTFALIHEYRGIDKNLPSMYHFDLYRLNSFNELIDIGLEEYTASNNIVVLEWADRFEELTHFLTHRVEIEVIDSTTRGLTIIPNF